METRWSRTDDNEHRLHAGLGSIGPAENVRGDSRSHRLWITLVARPAGLLFQNEPPVLFYMKCYTGSTASTGFTAPHGLPAEPTSCDGAGETPAPRPRETPAAQSGERMRKAARTACAEPTSGVGAGVFAAGTYIDLERWHRRWCRWNGGGAERC